MVSDASLSRLANEYISYLLSPSVRIATASEVVSTITKWRRFNLLIIGIIADALDTSRLLFFLISSASSAVYDPNELLLGAVVFYYRQPNFNNQENEDVVNLIGQFKNSVESIFLNYHLDRKAKKRELGLESDIEED